MIVGQDTVFENNSEGAAHCQEPNPESKWNKHLYRCGVNRGLPVLDGGAKHVSRFEFWPAWVFYLPVVVYWVFLSMRYRSFGLPMLANPEIPLGGMIGESKIEILDAGGSTASPYVLAYVLREISADILLYKRDDSYQLQVDNDITAARERGIVFPFVVKPELGCRGAGVRVIASKSELLNYLLSFPPDRRYIIQQMAPYGAEAGVFYERFPGEKQGRVTSLTLKYRPVVVGDGLSSVACLILRDPRAAILRDLYTERNRHRCHWVPQKGEEVALSFAGSHCRGSIFRNGNAYITEHLSKKIDEIMSDFPSFHYGRLDIKFKNMDELQRGLDFHIIEVNGVSSEKTHIWDSRESLKSAFLTLLEQYGTLFKMGAALRAKGHTPPSIMRLISTWLSELKSARRYPATD